MAEEKTLSSRQVFNGGHLRLRIDTVRTADGGESTREIIEVGDAVVVIAVDDDENILLVRQYRKAVEMELLELPAGSIDPGEDADTAVRREMQEETGYLPGKVERLGGFYSTPGFCTEYLYLYLATELTSSQLHAEDTAGISLVRMPVSEISSLLTSGKIKDAKSIAGLHMYLEHRKTG
ncbi:MAG: NUDIX hydrolase [Dehalococcoidales bacterium]|nr:MAG: NUDIX hydrolase [Dehalococcoidales bacterium]